MLFVAVMKTLDCLHIQYYASVPVSVPMCWGLHNLHCISVIHIVISIYRVLRGAYGGLHTVLHNSRLLLLCCCVASVGGPQPLV